MFGSVLVVVARLVVAGVVVPSSGAVVGAVVGTSTTTSYIESAAGVSAGARTGLANLVTAALFLIALFIGSRFVDLADTVGLWMVRATMIATLLQSVCATCPFLNRPNSKMTNRLRRSCGIQVVRSLSRGTPALSASSPQSTSTESWQCITWNPTTQT